MLNKSNHLITIDGPAASGKTTVALCVARQINFIAVSSGLFYRGITWGIIKYQISNETSLISWIETFDIEPRAENSMITIYHDGINITNDLMDKKIAEFVSFWSIFSVIRDRVSYYLNHLHQKYNLIVEGRDIGSVVFPQAKWKFYLDANIEERVARRSKDRVNDFIHERDNMDMNRKISPLVVPDGAIFLDSTNCAVDDICKKLLSYIEIDKI